MNFDKFKIDEELRVKGEVIHFILPYYTKSKMKIIDKISTLIFKGKKPNDDDIDYNQINIKRTDETSLRVCIYSNNKLINNKSIALLWIHGGGYAMSEPEQDYIFFKNFVKKYNVKVFVPDYTKSLKKPFPAGFEDVKLTYEYIKKHYKEYNIDKNKIIVGGDSAGGGLAIALSLFARDNLDNSIVFCMPIYPMINNQHTQTSMANAMPVWNTKSNDVAWRLYLKDIDDAGYNYKYAVPSKETNYSNLPPMISYVGTEDPFYAETVKFFENLIKDNNYCKLKILEGCYHGFDVVCPRATKSVEAKKFLIEEFDKIYNNIIDKS